MNAAWGGGRFDSWRMTGTFCRLTSVLAHTRQADRWVGAN